MGVAILDGRDLTSSPPRTAISKYNFVTGSPSYCTATSKKYLFGKTITIRQRDILSNLEPLVPRTRNIILVGHDIRNDLRVLQLLDFDLHTSIGGILDVRRIVSKTLPNIPDRLSSILSELVCPFQNLHTAGNDAYFTLRALLLLAIRDHSEEEVDSNHQEILSALKAITNVSIPRKADPQAKNIKKKQKRFEKNRKHQSKLWDIETQEQIRAERAARRIKNECNLRDYSEEEINSNHQEILSALEAITNVSIPRRSDPQAKNINEKQKRFQKNRKHQSKTWDVETQEQIRAERAARRVKNESNFYGSSSEADKT